MIDKYRLDDLRLESGEKGELARWVIQLQKDLDYERRKVSAPTALAAVDAEPVGEVSVQPDGLVMDGTVHFGGSRTHRVIKGLNKMKRLPLGTKFYTAPPAPVVNVRLPDASSKAFWSRNGKDEVFHPETYKRWVKEAIERACAIARIEVRVK